MDESGSSSNDPKMGASKNPGDNNGDEHSDASVDDLEGKDLHLETLRPVDFK